MALAGLLPANSPAASCRALSARQDQHQRAAPSLGLAADSARRCGRSSFARVQAAKAGVAEKKKSKAVEMPEEEEEEEETGGEVVEVEEREVVSKEKDGKKKAKKVKVRKIKFVKYQGLGNDFIMIDNRKQEEPILTPEEAIKVCNRNFGVGGDGVIFLLPAKKAQGAQYAMRIFNSDGSEPEMCGNGIRCLARFLQDLKEDEGVQQYVVWTLAGNMVLNCREDGQVQVDMGEPRLLASEIPTTLAPTSDGGAVINAPLDVAGDTWNVTCVSMGNPHCIVFSSKAHPEGIDVDALDLATIGPQFEKHPVFPARINTEFVQVISPTELKMRVWERGAGPTLACGTGACALTVAAVLEGRAERKCLVHLPGGPLEIEWRASDNRIYMTGPAEEVFSGRFRI